MSWAEDMGYDAYDGDDIRELKPKRITVLDNGNKICANCGSKNIKVSKAGNKYCADLCWVDNTAEDEACGMGFQDWRNDNDHE